MEQKNNYDGPFPVIELAGTSFYVNGYLMELVQVDDPANHIGMFDMLCLEDHTELWYDTGSKRPYNGSLVETIPENVQLFWLYPLDAIDPLGKNAWMDENRPGWRHHFPADLPVVRIAGKDFFVDEVRNAFRDKENCWNLIHFSDVIKQNGKTGIYIDTRVTQVPFPHEFDPYKPVAELPEHIIFAEVPDGHHLAMLLNKYHSNALNQDQADPVKRGR